MQRLIQSLIGDFDLADDQAVHLGLRLYDLRHRLNENIQALALHDPPHHDHKLGVQLDSELGAYASRVGRNLEIVFRSMALGMMRSLRKRTPCARCSCCRGLEVKMPAAGQRLIRRWKSSRAVKERTVTMLGRPRLHAAKNARFGQGQGVVQVNEVD